MMQICLKIFLVFKLPSVLKEAEGREYPGILSGMDVCAIYPLLALLRILTGILCGICAYSPWHLCVFHCVFFLHF